MRQLGGAVEGGHDREFGRAEILIERPSPLLEGLGEPGAHETVWMSHGDKITAIPLGFEVVAASEGSPFAVIADEGRRFYGIQFHPEVAHTPRGADAAQLHAPDRGPQRRLDHGLLPPGDGREDPRQVGQGRVICGLSGGVDHRWPRC